MKKTEEEKYALVKPDGKWLVETNYHSSELVINVRKRKHCLRIIEMFYKDKGYKVKKII